MPKITNKFQVVQELNQVRMIVVYFNVDKVEKYESFWVSLKNGNIDNGWLYLTENFFDTVKQRIRIKYGLKNVRLNKNKE